MSSTLTRHSAMRATQFLRLRFGRTVLLLSGFLMAGGLVACDADQSADSNMTADLERDLDMAINARRPSLAVVSSIEAGGRGAPSGSQSGQRAAVRNAHKHMEPEAAPEAEAEAAGAGIESEVPVSEVAAASVAVSAVGQEAQATAPAADTATYVPVMGGVSYPTNEGTILRGDDRRSGRGSSSGDDGEGVGRVIGVIIRGGSAGEDHCEEPPIGRRGRGGAVTTGGVIGGIIGGVIGGAIGGRGTPARVPNRYPRR